MTLKRITNLLLAVSVVGLLLAESVSAQSGAASDAGARPRVFNPFEIGPSRFAINPFGVLSITEVSPFANPFATRPVFTPLASGNSAPAVVAESSSFEPPMEVLVRPPFRPPVRSPYRPPPR